MIPSRTRMCCVYCVLFYTKLVALLVAFLFHFPRPYYQAASRADFTVVEQQSADDPFQDQIVLCILCTVPYQKLVALSVPSCFILPRSYYQAAPGQILQFSLLMIPARTRLCCVDASNNSNPEQMTTRSTIIIDLECINVSQMNLSSLVCHTFTSMSRPITFCTFTRAVDCHLAVTFKNGL